MKKYTVTLWRGNPQFENGGYKTIRTVEARTLASAKKKAREFEKCLYGSMTVIDVKEKE